MKKINIAFTLFLAAVMVFTACQPNEHELGPIPEKSQIQFEVTQDLVNDPGGNTVILKNNTPGTIARWDYGTGISTKPIDTVHFAFKGNYVIKFSVVSGGGIVDADPTTVKVTGDNLNYVNDPLWTALSGGVGKSKTWIIDNGNYGFAAGPFSYADPSATQAWENYTINWDPGSVGQTTNDMATEMTFSLIGGPFLTTVKPNESTGNESGTYYLDQTNHTLTTTGATIIRLASIIPNANNWNSSLRILELNENQLRIAVFRTNSEGPWWYVFNYVSKEYADSYVPVPKGPDEGFKPTFAPGELLTMLTGGASSGRNWQLDGDGNPVDWIGAGHGWTKTSADSYNWGWSDSWADVADNSWIRFDEFGGTKNYTRYQGGVTTTGTFTIDESTNEITLGSNTLLQNTDSWMNPTTNKITVIKAFNADYKTKGIWFGTSYDATKDEWFVFHYILP